LWPPFELKKKTRLGPHPILGGNERSSVRNDEDNGRIKGERRAKNGSLMIDKRLKRKRVWENCQKEHKDLYKSEPNTWGQKKNKSLRQVSPNTTYETTSQEQEIEEEWS
jgi:hypothetical protein